MADPLPADLAGALSCAAADLGPYADLTWFQQIDSTNDAALSLAAAGAPEGRAVLAGQQRAGRGRRGRSWFSPPGAGLYLSVVIRPRLPADRIALVTLGAGVAAASAVSRAAGLPVELKWPNDLVVGRPWRKLAGVLCEAVGTGARLDAVVVGIGINLRPAAYPPAIADRATSVETELGRDVERGALVVACLRELRSAMDALRDGGAAAICDRWRRFAGAGLARAAVHWHDQGTVRRGHAIDIDDAGALLVECGGAVERLIAGEVTWGRPFHG